MSTPPPFQDRPVWRERIGTYLLGVAIGLVLVGVFIWGRSQAAQRLKAERDPAAPASGAPAAPP